jgi:anti-sigma factor RsiW
MSGPKTCSAIENELALFVGGELEPDSRAEIEEHLGRCPACAAAAERLSASRAALRAGLEQGPADFRDLWPGVRARLLESGAIRAAPIPQATAPVAAPRRSMPRWFPISAAAALLVAFGLWLAQSDQPAPPPRPVDAIPVATSAPLRRLAPGESALSIGATSIEQLQEEVRLKEALGQPAGAQSASQRRGMQ